MTCRTIYRIFFQEDHHSPVVYLELTAKQKIKQIQRSTGNSLLVDMGWGEVESSLEDIVSAFLKLKEIAINFVWSSRRIKHFCRFFFIYRQVPVVLFVPHENYPKYHRQLGGADFITLHPFLLDYSPYASSSEEEYERLDVNAKNQPRSSNKRKPTISNEGCSPPSDLSEEDVPAEAAEEEGEAARKQAEENAQAALIEIQRILANRVPEPPRQKKVLPAGFGQRMKIWYGEHADRDPLQKALRSVLSPPPKTNDTTVPSEAPSTTQEPGAPSSQVSSSSLASTVLLSSSSQNSPTHN